MKCKHCKNGKLEVINRFPYLTFAKFYYKCNICDYEIGIIYQRELLRKKQDKLYVQLWSN